MTTGIRWTTIFAVIGLTAGLSMVGALPAQAATLDVCAVGGTYTTIQSAVDAAASGDTITLCAGTYAESVTISTSLTISGPNAGISPNTSGDPLTANTARVAEAIIAPANIPNAHAFTLAATAADVRIEGVKVVLPGAADQRYLSATAQSDTTLRNNWFTGAGDGNLGDEGYLAFYGQLGTSTITVDANRFSNAGESNGLRVYSSSAAATTTLQVTGNVWLDNGSNAMNFEFLGGAVGAGTVSGNWIGDSTPVSVGDHWGTQQSGLILAGANNGLQVTGNVFSNVEDRAVIFWETFSGTASFTDNTIDGYNNVATYGAVGIRDGADVDGVTLTGNTFDNGTLGSRVLSVRAGATGTLNATMNWWGQPQGPLSAQLEGTGNLAGLLIEPWLAGTGPAGTPADGVTVTEGKVALVGSPGNAVVTVPAGAISGTGDAWFEYSTIPAALLPLAGSLPFSPGSVVLDITLQVNGTAAVSGPFTVCVDGTGSQQLWHYEGGAWVDITNRTVGSAVLTVGPGQVCGMVNSFSPFALSDSMLAATGLSTPLVWGGSLLAALLLVGGVALLLVRRRRTARS